MIEHDSTYKLDKSVWTIDDFDQMGWHDSKIHAISMDSVNFKILFDIDYIFEWVKPKPNNQDFSFWVSPCTLIFENVCNVTMDIELTGADLEINEIIRGTEGIPGNHEWIGKTREWQWIINCFSGEMIFTSVGYTLYARKAPQHVDAQSLSSEERGGINFSLASL